MLGAWLPVFFCVSAFFFLPFDLHPAARCLDILQGGDPPTYPLYLLHLAAPLLQQIERILPEPEGVPQTSKFAHFVDDAEDAVAVVVERYGRCAAAEAGADDNCWRASVAFPLPFTFSAVSAFPLFVLLGGMELIAGARPTCQGWIVRRG